MKTINSLSKIIFIPVLILITSCEKNDDDQRLKEQVIGNWKSTNSYYRSYTFYQDHTFIDSLFTLENNSFQTREIISGTYKIENGLLIITNVQLSYHKGQENETLLHYSTTYAQTFIISFDGDVLKLKQKDVFELDSGSHSGIIGKWKFNKLAVVYDKNSLKRFSGGVTVGNYDFKSDKTLDYQYQIYYDNIAAGLNESTVNYELTNSKLNINTWGVYDVEVSFGRNNMIWLYKDLTFQKNK